MKKSTIRELRLKRGLSQAEVAAALGRDQSWVSLVELGRLLIDEAKTSRILVAIERLAEHRRRLREAVALLPSPVEVCADLRLSARVEES